MPGIIDRRSPSGRSICDWSIAETVYWGGPRGGALAVFWFLLGRGPTNSTEKVAKISENGAEINEQSWKKVPRTSRRGQREPEMARGTIFNICYVDLCLILTKPSQYISIYIYITIYIYILYLYV